jgi:hypothetical protein
MLCVDCIVNLSCVFLEVVFYILWNMFMNECDELIGDILNKVVLSSVTVGCSTSV